MEDVPDVPGLSVDLRKDQDILKQLNRSFREVLLPMARHNLGLPEPFQDPRGFSGLFSMRLRDKVKGIPALCAISPARSIQALEMYRRRDSMIHEMALFESSTETIDGREFKACEFRNCQLIYHGGPVKMVQCHFVNCQWIFEEAAGRTVEFLRSMLGGGMGPRGQVMAEAILRGTDRR